MGLSASAMDRQAETSANGKHDASRRKPLMPIASAAVASIVVGTVIVASSAVLNYKPTQQHVEIELKCDGEPCKVSAR